MCLVVIQLLVHAGADYLLQYPWSSWGPVLHVIHHLCVLLAATQASSAQEMIKEEKPSYLHIHVSY